MRSFAPSLLVRLFVPLLVLSAAAPLVGCSTSAAVAERGILADGRQVYGDVERLEFSKQAQIRVPSKLAVHDDGERTGFGEPELGAKRTVAAVRELSRDDDLWVDVVTLGAGEAPRPATLEELRARASSHHADLMLVVDRREEVREGHNAAAILKILLLPMLFLPTEEDELTLAVRAALVDVRNGLVYTTYEDHRRHELSASVAGESAAVREGFDALYAETLPGLRERLRRRLRAPQ